MHALLDQTLDRLVVPGYTSAGFALRKRGWDDLPADALAGRHILITGASSGIGAAAVAGAARLGATVHMLVRNPERGERARAEIAAGGIDPEPPAPLDLRHLRPRRGERLRRRLRGRGARPLRPRPQRRRDDPGARAQRPGPRADLRHPRARSVSAHAAARAGPGPRRAIVGRLRHLRRHVHGQPRRRRSPARTARLRRPPLLRARQADPGDPRRGAGDPRRRTAASPTPRCTRAGPTRPACAAPCPASAAWSALSSAAPSRAPTPSSGCWPPAPRPASPARSGTTAAPGPPTSCPAPTRPPEDRERLIAALEELTPLPQAAPTTTKGG